MKQFREFPSHWNAEKAINYALQKSYEVKEENGINFVEIVYRRSFVRIEDGPVFPCYLMNMDAWNGWMNPYFPEDVIDDVIEFFNDPVPQFTKLDNGDVRYHCSDHGDDIDDDDIFYNVTIDTEAGEKTVCDMSAYFIWTECNEKGEWIE